MKYERVSIGLKRSVRHARFNIVDCSVILTAELGEGDTLRSVSDEIREDLVILVEEMVEVEKQKYQEEKIEIKNK